MQANVKLKFEVDSNGIDCVNLVDSITEEVKSHYNEKIVEIIDEYFSEEKIASRIKDVMNRLFESALRYSTDDGENIRNDNYYSKKIIEHLDKHIACYLNNLKEEDFKNMILSRLMSKMK